MEGDGKGYLLWGQKEFCEEVGLEYWMRGTKVDPLQLAIRRASVLQISGLSRILGGKAEATFRDKWALISAFSP